MKNSSIPKPDKLPKPVMVTWEDAKVISNGGAWIDNDDKKYEPQYFWQVGFIVKDTAEGIILTEAWSPDLIANATQIPRGMIREIRKLS